jgi:hypothetical protein
MRLSIARIGETLGLTLFVLVAFALAPTSGSAATLHVDAANGTRTVGCGTESTPCVRLADALAIAADGDVIEVAPGDYDAATVSHEVTVRGIGSGQARVTGQLALDAPAALSRLAFSGAASGVLVRGSAHVTISSSSFDGSSTPIQVDGAATAGTIFARGNRIVGGPLVNGSALATIDARRNWWGSNAGTSALQQVGSVDVSDPLHLAGVSAPALLLPGSSGELAVTLVGADGVVEPAAGGFDVSFTTTSGTLDATRVGVTRGRAAALLTATTPGAVTVTATLDAEQLTATTEVRAATRPGPASADARPAATVAHPFVARMRVLRRGLSHALSRGVRIVVASNRRTSVRGWAYVDARIARQLGLRDPRSDSFEPFIIGKVHTRAAAGSRIVRIELSRRARYAMSRYDHRFAIFVVARISTSSGATRLTWRRVALPGNVR